MNDSRSLVSHCRELSMTYQWTFVLFNDNTSFFLTKLKTECKIKYVLWKKSTVKTDTLFLIWTTYVEHITGVHKSLQNKYILTFTNQLNEPRISSTIYFMGVSDWLPFRFTQLKFHLFHSGLRQENKMLHKILKQL